MSDNNETSGDVATLAALRSDLEALSSMPLPDTTEGRVALLESHLRGVLDTLSASDRQFDAATDLDGFFAGVRETASWLYSARRPVAFDVSPCGTAVLEGLGLITAGSVIGPGGALLGFGAGVYLLTQHCGEGDTFFS